MKSVIAAMLLLAINAPAQAGLIHWGFVSTNSQLGNYSVDGASGVFETESGQSQAINAIGGFTAPPLISLIPVDGPTLTTDLTITDTASGAAGMLVLPIRFYDNETAPEGEIDQHIAAYGSFDAKTLDLGPNRYLITGDGASIFVSVAPSVETPEPSTLALSVVGATWVSLKQRRKRKTLAN